MLGQTVLVPPRKDVPISAVLHTLLQERTARQAAEQLAACTKAESEAAVRTSKPPAQHAGHLCIMQCLKSQQRALTASEHGLLSVLKTPSARYCMLGSDPVTLDVCHLTSAMPAFCSCLRSSAALIHFLSVSAGKLVGGRLTRKPASASAPAAA